MGGRRDSTCKAAVGYAILLNENIWDEVHMALVKVRSNGEVNLPLRLRKQARLSEGDVLEAKLEKGRITLTPKSLADSHISESMEQIKKGKFYGPFDSAEEMIESLHRSSNRSKKNSKRTTRK